MPNDINIPIDGILGKDFLRTRSIINNIENKLLLEFDGLLKEIPILTHTLCDLNILHTTIIDRAETVIQEIKINNELPSDEMHALCRRFSHIFHLKGEKLTTNNFFKYTLKLNDTTPVYIKNYRTVHSQKTGIEANIQKLLQDDVIEPNYGPYNSPTFPVPKKSENGIIEERLVSDFRGVNKKLIHDTYPLPRMDDILDELGDNKFFSILDLTSGFHQIELTEDCRDITAFSTQSGSFRYKVLPFGLKVSPSAFARMIASAFSSLPYNVCFTYLDDIIIVGKSEAEHLHNIEQVFSVCERLCLKLNPKKCKFFKTQVTYLGHTCTSDGILPDTAKYSAIKNYPRPQSKDEAKRFVAYCNYFRKFIKNFASLAAPINKNTRKAVDFNWTKECEDNFNKLKSILMSPDVLHYPDFSKPFVITCDASKIACGSVLSQVRDGVDVPIAYHSQPFTKGESNKAPIEQELLAIFYSIKHFRPYIYGTRFKIRSDHKPLVYLFSLKDPSSRLTRIRLELEEYDFQIEYIKGTTNVVADALSRVTIEELKEINASVYAMTRAMTRALNDAVHSDQGSSQSTQIIAQNDVHTDQGSVNRNNIPNVMAYEPLHINSSKKPHMKSYGVVESIERDNSKNPSLNVFKTLKSQKPIFSVNLPISRENKTIQLGEALSTLDEFAKGHNISEIALSLCDPIFSYVAPDIFKSVANAYLNSTQIHLKPKIITVYEDEEKQKILETFHKDPIFGGHPGQSRLLAKIATQFQWKNLRKDVAAFVKNCSQCRLNKPKISTREPLCITPTPAKPFERVVIDTVGPLFRSQNGNTYILTAVCDLTKYIITIPIANKEAKTIARSIMNEIILIYGPMKQILTDKGTEFLNSTMNELCALLNIQKHHSTAYHHETLGSIERNHRELNEYMRTYLNQPQTDWEELLKYFSYCYNATPHSAFNFKYSPFELIFSKKPLDFSSIFQNNIDPVYNIDNYAKEAKLRLQTALEQAKKLLENSKEKAKKFYDRNIRPLNVKVGEKVLLNDFTRHKLLDPMYKGTFTVLENKQYNLVLKNDNNQKIIEVHKNNIRKF